jgi:ACT domain-containing protein
MWTIYNTLMPKINEEIHQEKLLSIRQLLVQCYADHEIIEKLSMPRSTFYKYKAALHAESLQNMKQQNLTDYGLYVDQLIDRLKLIFHYVSLRIADQSRISNRDLSTLSAEAKNLSYDIMQLEKQRYNIIFPDKKELPGQPALIYESNDSEDDGAFDSSGDHIKSTDRNPIV